MVEQNISRPNSKPQSIKNCIPGCICLRNTGLEGPSVIICGKMRNFAGSKIMMSVKIGNIDLGEFPLLLAPMEDVSDPPFRYVCKQNGADMMYTEFISSEGLIRNAAKSRQKLDIFEYERPIGIQIFGSEIDHMREATEIATLANPDLM